MKKLHFLAAFGLLVLACSLASASDTSPLQDYCIPLNSNGVNVPMPGFCQDPSLATPDDFFFQGLNIPANTSNPLGSAVKCVTFQQIPGLNTLGISLVRFDYADWGMTPPHIHPRATEILVVQKGTLYVGFVTSDKDEGNRLLAKILYPGDVYVFPMGLIHFQINVGNTNAVAIAALNSQNPGVLTIANAIFGSNPPINPDVLAKKLDKNIVTYLQNQSWWQTGTII